MTKEDLFAKMKYRLEEAYPQYDFKIKETALIMSNKNPQCMMEAITVPILRYEKETDKMVLFFPKIISVGKNTSSQVKEIVSPSIDTFRLDYYNVNEQHIDFIVENLFSGIIQKQVIKYEDMKKDFE